MPQSAQSVAKAHCENSAPGPPSSHSPSCKYVQVLPQPGGDGGVVEVA